MNTFRLIYFSENHLDHGPDQLPQEIEAILAQSRANNFTLGLTGALVYDNLWFVQVLEGERAAVWRTFLKILSDQRHERVVLVEAGPVAGRQFGEWSMAFASRTPATAAILARYSDRGRLTPAIMAAPDLLQMMQAAVLGSIHLGAQNE